MSGRLDLPCVHWPGDHLRVDAWGGQLRVRAVEAASGSSITVVISDSDVTRLRDRCNAHLAAHGPHHPRDDRAERLGIAQRAERFVWRALFGAREA